MKCICLLKPLYPQLISLFLLHTLHQFVFKTQIHIFSSQVSRTHAADSAFIGAYMLTQSPTPLLYSLFHHTGVKVLNSLSLSVCVSGQGCVSLPLSSGSQQSDRTLPSGSYRINTTQDLN